MWANSLVVIFQWLAGKGKTPTKHSCFSPSSCVSSRGSSTWRIYRVFHSFTYKNKIIFLENCLTYHPKLRLFSKLDVWHLRKVSLEVHICITYILYLIYVLWIDFNAIYFTAKNPIPCTKIFISPRVRSRICSTRAFYNRFGLEMVNIAYFLEKRKKFVHYYKF